MTNQQPSTRGGPPAVLLAAIEKLLRPLVKLLLSYQITYPLLISMLKSLYVDVAEKDFQVNNKRQSDSRINLLTGVHRKDVKRLRSEERQNGVTPAAVSTGAQIIGHWIASPEFLDEDGNPRALALSDSQELPGFDELVEKVCRQDIRPRVILDEWLRLGVAHLENDQVLLNTGAFTPEKGFDEKVYFFGKSIQDHISAGTHNLQGGKPSYFDRSVYYDQLSEQSVSELAELAEDIGMNALKEMNKQALSKQKQDKHKPDAEFRINFAIFNYNTRNRRDIEQ